MIVAWASDSVHRPDRQVSLRVAGCVWRGFRYIKHFSRQKLSTTGSHEKTISFATPPMSEQHHSNR